MRGEGWNGGREGLKVSGSEWGGWRGDVWKGNNMRGETGRIKGEINHMGKRKHCDGKLNRDNEGKGR